MLACQSLRESEHHIYILGSAFQAPADNTHTCLWPFILSSVADWVSHLKILIKIASAAAPSCVKRLSVLSYQNVQAPWKLTCTYRV